jgi:hypothetical protein
VIYNHSFNKSLLRIVEWFNILTEYYLLREFNSNRLLFHLSKVRNLLFLGVILSLVDFISKYLQSIK